MKNVLIYYTDKEGKEYLLFTIEKVDKEIRVHNGTSPHYKHFNGWETAMKYCYDEIMLDFVAGYIVNWKVERKA